MWIGPIHSRWWPVAREDTHTDKALAYTSGWRYYTCLDFLLTSARGMGRWRRSGAAALRMLHHSSAAAIQSAAGRSLHLRHGRTSELAGTRVDSLKQSYEGNWKGKVEPWRWKTTRHFECRGPWPNGLCRSCPTSRMPLPICHHCRPHGSGYGSFWVEQLRTIWCVSTSPAAWFGLVTWEIWDIYSHYALSLFWCIHKMNGGSFTRVIGVNLITMPLFRTN
jgi:hypothetical protein